MIARTSQFFSAAFSVVSPLGEWVLKLWRCEPQNCQILSRGSFRVLIPGSIYHPHLFVVKTTRSESSWAKAQYTRTELNHSGVSILSSSIFLPRFCISLWSITGDTARNMHSWARFKDIPSNNSLRWTFLLLDASFGLKWMNYYAEYARVSAYVTNIRKAHTWGRLQTIKLVISYSW